MGGLAERLQGMEAETYDACGEAQFVLGFGVVGGQHLSRGLAGLGWVVVGTGEEEQSEAGQDRFQNGGWERG